MEPWPVPPHCFHPRRGVHRCRCARGCGSSPPAGRARGAAPGCWRPRRAICSSTAPPTPGPTCAFWPAAPAGLERGGPGSCSPAATAMAAAAVCSRLWAGRCWCRNRRPTCCRAWSPCTASPQNTRWGKGCGCCGHRGPLPGPAWCMWVRRERPAGTGCSAAGCWFRWRRPAWRPCVCGAPSTGGASCAAWSGCAAGCRPALPAGSPAVPDWALCGERSWWSRAPASWQPWIWRR